MAIDAYLKTAAAQLRRAAVALRDDINGVQRYISSKETDTQKTIKDLEKQIRLRKEEAGRTDDTIAKAERIREVAQLQQEIKQLQAQLDQEKQDRLNQMRTMEQTTQQLNSHANDLERQPGSF